MPGLSLLLLYDASNGSVGAVLSAHNDEWTCDLQVRNLYVADASIFPTATGVNPMITVEAMSYMVAQGLAAKFKEGAVQQSQKAACMPEE